MAPIRRPSLFSLVSCILLSIQCTFAQAGTTALDTLNRVDELGRKQGFWKVTAPAADKPGYADGQLVEEGRYTNSKRTGAWKRYWPNGRLMSEITYQMGRPRGAYKTYYPTGKLEEQGNWDPRSKYGQVPALAPQRPARAGFHLHRRRGARWGTEILP